MATKKPTAPELPPRIQRITIKNYRALRDLVLDDVTPLTVLLGPNGSGKSTVFDVFSCRSECFTVGLRKAWDKRGRFRELRTRGCQRPDRIRAPTRHAATCGTSRGAHAIGLYETWGNHHRGGSSWIGTPTRRTSC
jgi:predicted ATPase